ncbi:amidohydrolase family protein [Ruixingdingia sedimenti]|uniref:Amidohydrolase family protein n=1 Tax=Ruixingdingia sedimenti TaxID=3073604 RepID=A0ABU1F5D2_9RHOB|nr:amidohydrolase family protein [Xinfangfangia sp. LG-4]MDR5651632.1 amidohydrolase family protein [Xinfangfangia sp. LG-4]
MTQNASRSGAPPDHAAPLPAGTVDTHFHVFGPAARYPYAEGRSYTPGDASLDDYLRALAPLGVARGVLVQPSVYGTDNTCMLDALRAPPLPLRGIAVVDADVTEAELDAMHALGVRGIRINLVFAAGKGFETARALAPRLKARGWHVQFLVDVSTLPDLRAAVAGLDVALVFDHMGHVPAAKGVGDPGFRALLALMAEGRAWAKVSGAYRMTAPGARPPYGDVAPFAAAVLAANPERVVWASDWPHTALHVPMPDDADLAAMVLDWVRGPALRQRLFVTNPQALYGFDP